MVAELLGRLLEHRIRFRVLCWYSSLMASSGLVALLFGRGPDRLELAADRGRAGTGGFRHDARDVAGAFLGGGQQFIEQAGEARQPLIEIGGAQIDGGDQRFQRATCARRPKPWWSGCLFDHGRGVDQRVAMGFELARQRAEVLQRLPVLELKTVSWSSSVCVATPLREVTSFMAETKSATRVTSARSSELRLSWAPVSTSCSRMLPSRSRSNRATVSVRRILLVSCISVTAAIET